jgi:hypothetical protein
MVKSGSKVVNDIPGNGGNVEAVDIKWISLECWLRSLRLSLHADRLEGCFAERQDGRFQFVEMLLGPFNFYTDQSESIVGGHKGETRSGFRFSHSSLIHMKKHSNSGRKASMHDSTVPPIGCSRFSSGASTNSHVQPSKLISSPHVLPVLSTQTATVSSSACMSEQKPAKKIFVPSARKSTRNRAFDSAHPRRTKQPSSTVILPPAFVKPVRLGWKTGRQFKFYAPSVAEAIRTRTNIS